MRATVDMSVRSFKKKVAGMVVHLANPLPIAMSSCLDNLPFFHKYSVTGDVHK
jgi:hypothetical protein